MKLRYCLLLLLPLFTQQCSMFSSKKEPVVRDTTMTAVSSFNNLFPPDSLI